MSTRHPTLLDLSLALLLVIGCETATPIPKPPEPLPIRVPIDAPPDADVMPDAKRIDPCLACKPGTICVQRFDGTCGLQTECVPETVKCPDRACTEACARAYCGGQRQCQNRVPCGTESPTAFTCYGS